MSQVTKTDLYRHFDENGTLLYVGVSLSAMHRLGQHKEHSHWYERIKNVTIEKFETRESALHAETMAIVHEKPEYNIAKKAIAQKIRKQIEEEERQKQIEEEEKQKHRKDKELLLRRFVWFNPFYSVRETADILRVSEPTIKSLIESNRLGAVIIGEKQVNGRWGIKTRRRYGVTGWQLIDFIETMEKEGRMLSREYANE